MCSSEQILTYYPSISYIQGLNTPHADGAWHRVGLVWDGAVRALYTDGILVAEDTLSGLAGSDGGLRLGCAADQAPDSFFSGLIDDVRIYNRAVRP